MSGQTTASYWVELISVTLLQEPSIHHSMFSQCLLGLVMYLPLTKLAPGYYISIHIGYHGFLDNFPVAVVCSFQ